LNSFRGRPSPPARLLDIADPMTSAARRFIAWLTCAIAVLDALVPVRAQEGGNQSKASLVYKIAKHSTWPKEKMSDGTPFVIGVIGNSGILESLSELTGGRRFMGREVLVKRLDSVQEIPSCHILFIATSEQDRLGSLVSKARGADVLTIGESDNFLSKGGNFLLYENGHIRFEYDRRSLKRTDVKVSPELLFLAEPRVVIK
jgi:YfiR/HmsC-like